MYNPTSYEENKKKAWMITAIVHFLLLIFFLFYGLTQPDPLPEEAGVEVALGTTTTGFGKQAPTKVEETTEPVEEVKPDPTPTETNTPEPVTQDDSEIAVPKKEKKKEKKEEPKKEEPKMAEPKKEEEKRKKKIDPKSLYSKPTDSDSKSTYSGSKGTTVGKGNEGTPDGVPVGKGALGGSGGSWELFGRSLVSGVKIPDTKEEGTVVLNIWVDRQGNVIRTTPNLRESTTTSEYLFQLAENAAKRTRYSLSAAAAVEQRGKMTFVFILE